MQNTTPDVAALTARIDRLEREVAHHRDVLEIQDVLARYARALDWLDDDMLRTAFFDDAEIDYGFFRGSFREFAPILMQVERDVGRRWHMATQVKIHIDGDTAEVESYHLSLATPAVESVPPADIAHFYGFYVDRMQRRNGRWGIVRRKHLLISMTSVREVALEGPMGVLNKIGVTSTQHADFRRLTDARPLGTG
ncbi:MAG: nuclear transport factor 2 family protein [Steroidobacteraceae bacterium]